MGKNTKNIAVTLCALAGGLSVAEAQEVVCGEVIMTSKVLTSDLTCTMHNPALTIRGPGGSLDMRGFTLSCGGLGGEMGSYLDGSGAVLQNGTGTACDDGVVAAGSRESRDHRVPRLTLRNNDHYGLLITTGGNNQVLQNTARDNVNDGFHIDGVGDNLLSRNIAIQWRQWLRYR